MITQLHTGSRMPTIAQTSPLRLPSSGIVSSLNNDIMCCFTCIWGFLALPSCCRSLFMNYQVNEERLPPPLIPPERIHFSPRRRRHCRFHGKARSTPLRFHRTHAQHLVLHTRVPTYKGAGCCATAISRHNASALPTVCIEATKFDPGSIAGRHAFSCHTCLSNADDPRDANLAVAPYTEIRDTSALIETSDDSRTAYRKTGFSLRPSPFFNALCRLLLCATDASMVMVEMPSAIISLPKASTVSGFVPCHLPRRTTTMVTIGDRLLPSRRGYH